MKKIRDYKKQYEMEKSILKDNKPIKCEKRKYDFFDAHSFYWEIEDIFVPYYIEGISSYFCVELRVFSDGEIFKKEYPEGVSFHLLVIDNRIDYGLQGLPMFPEDYLNNLMVPDSGKDYMVDNLTKSVIYPKKRIKEFLMESFRYFEEDSLMDNISRVYNDIKEDCFKEILKIHGR